MHPSDLLLYYPCIYIYKKGFTLPVSWNNYTSDHASWISLCISITDCSISSCGNHYIDIIVIGEL